VRDHCRPAFHKAIGMTPRDYDFKVFRLCSEISRQTFPLTLNLDDPRFAKGLEKMVVIARAHEVAKATPGLIGRFKRLSCAAQATFTFLQLYALPTQDNPLPREIRLEPVW
jgi:magnesium-protoporphyrin IX monomethyl ester (oxidative) cyclase